MLSHDDSSGFDPQLLGDSPQFAEGLFTNDHSLIRLQGVLTEAKAVSIKMPLRVYGVRVKCV